MTFEWSNPWVVIGPAILGGLAILALFCAMVGVVGDAASDDDETRDE